MTIISLFRSYINPKICNTLLLKYKRLYEIENISDESIHQVLHGIATDIPKTFQELNIKVYDNENRPLKIYLV